jgi:5'(3')-deoxyribonucleotidase
VKQETPKVLVEFCLPFLELKHIVDGLHEDENVIKLDFPVDDCFLQLTIPEESQGMADKVVAETNIMLQTYEA